MHCFLNLTILSILNRSPRNIIQYYSVLKTLQNTSRNRYNSPGIGEKINYLPRAGQPNPKRHQTTLLIEIYFVLFLEDLLQNTQHVLLEGIRRIDRVLTIGLIAENLNKKMPMVSKEYLSKEVKSWFLSSFNLYWRAPKATYLSKVKIFS